MRTATEQRKREARLERAKQTLIQTALAVAEADHQPYSKPPMRAVTGYIVKDTLYALLVGAAQEYEEAARRVNMEEK